MLIDNSHLSQRLRKLLSHLILRKVNRLSLMPVDQFHPGVHVSLSIRILLLRQVRVLGLQDDAVAQTFFGLQFVGRTAVPPGLTIIGVRGVRRGFRIPFHDFSVDAMVPLLNSEWLPLFGKFAQLVRERDHGRVLAGVCYVVARGRGEILVGAAVLADFRVFTERVEKIVGILSVATGLRCRCCKATVDYLENIAGRMIQYTGNR